MKRRNFLKILGIGSISVKALAESTKKEKIPESDYKIMDYDDCLGSSCIINTYEPKDFKRKVIIL